LNPTKIAKRFDRSFINQRQYIELTHQEGASESRVEVRDTILDVERGKQNYRCMGHGGGHLDLVTWDVSGFIHEDTA